MSAPSPHPEKDRNLEILVSALSCNPGFGSEGLVGFKTVEALAREHRVTLLASPPAEVPPGVEWIPCDARPVNFNEVGPDAWLRFEARQWWKVRGLRARRRFDVIHKVTPAPLVNSTLLHLHGIPLVIGPVLVAQAVPGSFAPLLARPTAIAGAKFGPRRLARGLIRRGAQRLNAGSRALDRATRILLGMREAWNHVPERNHSVCEELTWSGIEHGRFVPGDAGTHAGLRLLFVGRLVPYKGVELLLRALVVARARCAAELTIVGDGDPTYAAFLRDLAGELGIADAVRFVPAVARGELVRVYQKADVFCFPTLCDTYGIALLEAMSSGCAVVVSDTAGPQEIVAEGTGIRIPLGTPEQYVAEYAEALVRLANDAPLRHQLGARARQQVLKKHDWDQIALQLLDIYRRLGAQLASTHP